MNVLLNDYHIQFLHHLVQHRVRFVVIGGQARWLADRSVVTRDLDVWVSIAEADRPALDSALVRWSTAHPAHTRDPLLAPLPLRPGVQIAFPEYDGVLYHDRRGEMQSLSVADRIDVLTSIAGMDFDYCATRAVKHDMEDVVIWALCEADLEETNQRRSV